MSNSESNRVTMSILIVLPKATTSILGSSAIVDKIAWVLGHIYLISIFVYTVLEALVIGLSGPITY